MGNFRIYQDNYSDFTVVSNVFIDEYIEDANDAQLKIYLYLMRMLNADLATGVPDIADRFNYTEKDVMRALRYWEKKGILSLDYDSSKTLIGVHMLPLYAKADHGMPQSDTVSDTAGSTDHMEYTHNRPAIPAAASEPAKTLTLVTPQPAIKPVVMMDNYVKPQFAKDDLINFKSHASELVFIAEQYMHRTLTPSDLSTLLFISETLHFSDELTDYLLQYCVGRGKSNHRYIETVAIDWAQSGIKTPAEAKRYVSKYDVAYDVMRALGKNNTDPSTVELELINKWTGEFGFGMDMINEACARTVLSTDRARFKYADSILTKWHGMGISSIADALKSDPPVKKTQTTGIQSTNKFNQFAQNTYDYAELEKKLIQN